MGVALVALLASSVASAEVVFSDTFDGRDIRRAGAIPNFWSVISSPDEQTSVASKDQGKLHLLATNQAYANVALVSPVLDKLGFFSRPVTIALDDVKLESQGIPEGEARFKISLASSPTTAEKAGSVISIRIRSGLLLMGYRMDGFNLSSPPETLAGDHVNSVAVMPLKGVPTKLSLTLGPSPREGFIRYEIVALNDGLPVSRSGTIPLTISQWGGVNSAALIIDARRDSETSLPDSQTNLSVGEITATR
jgi:hypothetical protein